MTKQRSAAIAKVFLAFLALLAACTGAPAKPSVTLDTSSAGDAPDTVQPVDTTGDVAEINPLSGDDAEALPAPHTETLGGNRPVPVTVPATWTPKKKWPLILVLHGYGASGAIQTAYLGVQSRADSMGFVTLAPDGTVDANGSRFWNATAACCDFAHVGVDDVAYLSGLIDQAIAELAVDPARVYIVGHSNGGFMAYRLACEQSDKVNAIAVIAGATDLDKAACPAPKPVNVLHIHGTKDATIAYDGGANAGVKFPSAQASLAQWLARDGCGVDPTTLATVDFDKAVAGDETEQLQYPGCPSNLAVEHWRMVGSGHIPGFNNTFRDALANWLLARTRP